MYIGELIEATFVTRKEGVPVNADALPTAILNRNGVDSGETITITNEDTGVYKYSFTIPASFLVGDELNILITATIAGNSSTSNKFLGTILYTSQQSTDISIEFSNCIPTKDDFSFIDMQGSFKFYERLAPKCIEAQRFDLRPVLGKDMYEEVMEIVGNNNTITANSEMTQPAFSLVFPYLVNHVKYSGYTRYLKDSNATLTRFGIRQKSTPHSKIDSDTKKEQLRYYSSLARDYGIELREFLDDNSGDYPNWGNQESYSSPGISFSSS